MGLGGKPVLGIPPLSAHKQNKEIPLSAMPALFINIIDVIDRFYQFHKKSLLSNTLYPIGGSFANV